MRLLPLLGLVVAYHALPQETAGQSAAACDPVGTVQFICGVIGPEDLVVVPGSDWVIASGDAAGGAIKAINVRDRTATALFPAATPRLRLDARTYDSCPGPIDAEEKDRFRAHGLSSTETMAFHSGLLGNVRSDDRS